MKFLLFAALLFSGWSVFAQKDDAWFAFWNKDTTLRGYKDRNGIVRIEPKFVGLASVHKFLNIMPVTEAANGKWSSYYLTKEGKIVGRDSLWIFDFTADCEREGFIRFRDKKTDKVGMFDKNGKVAIPADYNAMSPVHNGLIVALRHAEKKFWDKDEHSGCNHFSWVNGQQILLDTSNNVLVEDFSYKGELNFLSLEKTPKPHPDKIRNSFLSKDGTYYSFIDFELEFRQWFLELCAQITEQKLTEASYNDITWSSPNSWDKSPKTTFVSRNYAILKAALSEVLLPECEYSISCDGLNPFMFEGSEFAEYYDDCGEPKTWLSPVMRVVVTHRKKQKFSQNHFEFLRTENGYKLICLSIAENKLK